MDWAWMNIASIKYCDDASPRFPRNIGLYERFYNFQRECKANNVS